MDAKKPIGRPTKHILQSQGGDSDLLKFYCTTNETTYGQHWEKFKPRNGRHVGTGYQANLRPGRYYNGALDHLDNPTMGYVAMFWIKSFWI